VVGITVGLACGLVAGAAGTSFAVGLAAGLSTGVSAWMAALFVAGFVGRFLMGLVGGALFALMLGSSTGLTAAELLGAYLGCGLLLGLPAGFSGGVAPSPSRTRLQIRWPDARMRRKIQVGIIVGIVFGLAYLAGITRENVPFQAFDMVSLLVFGLGLGTVYEIVGHVLTTDASQRPKRAATLHMLWSAREVRLGTWGGLVFLAFLPLYDLGSETPLDLAFFVLVTVVLGAMAGLTVGATVELIRGFEVPVDIEAAVSPHDLLGTDRKNAIFQACIVGVPIACLIGFPAGLVYYADFGAGAAAALGLVVGLVVGLVRLSGTAWGRWLILSRLWLPLTDRLPWTIMTFLEDAYQRGVLRRVGATYEFRHARLQDQLAGQARRRLIHASQPTPTSETDAAPPAAPRPAD
jgi:hypothetical protein